MSWSIPAKSGMLWMVTSAKNYKKITKTLTLLRRLSSSSNNIVGKKLEKSEGLSYFLYFFLFFF